MKGGAIARARAHQGYRRAQPAQCCLTCSFSSANTTAPQGVYYWPLRCAVGHFGAHPGAVCDRFKPKADLPAQPEPGHEEL